MCVCRIGICQQYVNQSKLCNSFYDSNNYTFTKNSKLVVTSELDGRIRSVLRAYGGECEELISKVLCHFFFAPCGENGLLHLPLSICPEECYYAKTVCESEWKIVEILLASVGLDFIDCDATGEHLQGLAPCCTDVGITIQSMCTRM